MAIIESIRYEYKEGLPNYSNATSELTAKLEEGETALEGLTELKKQILQNLVVPLDKEGKPISPDRQNLTASIKMNKRWILYNELGVGLGEAKELLEENNNDYRKIIEEAKIKEKECAKDGVDEQ